MHEYVDLCETYPGLTVRRPTGQRTNVTFTNNLDPAAGEMTVHNHSNHSSADNDGQPDTLLIPTGGSRIYTYEGIEEGNNHRGKMQFAPTTPARICFIATCVKHADDRTITQFEVVRAKLTPRPTPTPRPRSTT